MSYRLTPRMLQRFHRSLQRFHEQFDGGRCESWQQEELLVDAIRSDTTAQHHVRWKERGHDDKADILVTAVNRQEHALQIKSGQYQTGKEGARFLSLSGHRLGRFDGDLGEITRYLNTIRAEIICIPYRCEEDQRGRRHVYRLCYVDPDCLTGIEAQSWEKKSTTFVQTNAAGVEFSLRPKMSWQIWWRIPVHLLSCEEEWVIG